MSQPNINTPNSDLVSSLSQSQSYLSPNFLVILPGLTSSVRLCGVERSPAQQSEEEEEEEEILIGPLQLQFDIYLAVLQPFPGSTSGSEAVKSEANLGARHFEIERITAD